MTSYAFVRSHRLTSKDGKTKEICYLIQTTKGPLEVPCIYVRLFYSNSIENALNFPLFSS